MAAGAAAGCLAITIAQAGQRVLLIEADLRRPEISENLQLEAAVGLTTVLVGRISLEDAIQGSSVSNLSVLTSGTIPPNPSELLQSEAMREVLEKLRTKFDVIIVDAPPLLPVTGAALLTAQSDGALLVVRHSKTTKDQLAHAIDRLEAVDGRALGVVLNMVPNRRGSDVYGDVRLWLRLWLRTRTGPPRREEEAGEACGGEVRQLLRGDRL